MFDMIKNKIQDVMDFGQSIVWSLEAMVEDFVLWLSENHGGRDKTMVVSLVLLNVGIGIATFLVTSFFVAVGLPIISSGIMMAFRIYRRVMTALQIVRMICDRIDGVETPRFVNIILSHVEWTVASFVTMIADAIREIALKIILEKEMAKRGVAFGEGEMVKHFLFTRVEKAHLATDGVDYICQLYGGRLDEIFSA